MSYQYRGFIVSDEMHSALEAYAKQGRPLGDFLTAVLSNDLMDACGRADDFNLPNLPAFCAWVYNECPSPAHGSRAKVKAWLAKFEAERAASFHDDKEDGKPDRFVTTGEGDLDLASRPLRGGS